MNINSIKDFEKTDWLEWIDDDVHIAANLGVLRPEQILCSGSLTIGKGTYIYALHSIEVGGAIFSKSSISATGYIEARKNIDVSGLISAGGDIRTRGSIWAGSQIKSGEFVEAGGEICTEQNILVNGKVRAGWLIKARAITAGGCITSGGRIDAKHRVIAGVGTWHNGEKSYSTITCAELICSSHIGDLNIVKKNFTPKSCHGGQTGKFCSECGEKL